MEGFVERGVHGALANMFRREVTPHAVEHKADADTVTWAQTNGLVTNSWAAQRVAGIKAGSCAAHTYPHADEEVVILGGRLITWLFLFDDAFGEGPNAHDARDLISTLSSYSRAMRTGVRPHNSTAFHRALLDLRSSFLARTGSQDWMARFGESLHYYFDGCVMEYYARRANEPVGLPEYRRLRAWSIGTLPVFDLIELSKAPLTEREAYDPALDALRERASLLCAWANDIYSYRKETEAGDPMNVVAVVARQYKLDPDEAYGAVSEIFNTDWALFENERDSLLTNSSAATRAYVDGLEEWVFGNLAWTGLCHRYHLEARAVS